MSDNLERILLTNVPDFVDDWILKSTTPCGDLIHRLDANPSDRSKMIIFTKGQENAQMIATTLDNYNLYGHVIQARYGFSKSTEASNATNSNTIGADCSKHHEIQEDIQSKSAENGLEKHTSKTSQRPQSTSSSPPAKPDSRQDQVNTDSSEVSQRCRFCRRTGHTTWCCKKKAEYCKVNLTVKGKTPPGHQWPESSIVKVEGLHAGPIIKYIERCHLQLEKMNREQIRIMFAWLTNFSVCHDCGAAGHQRADGLCKYLPLGRPLTEEIIADFKIFGLRMKGIRDKVLFGKLQEYARNWNQKFSGGMDTTDGRPSEKSQSETPAEPTDKIEQHNPPMESGQIIFTPSNGKRIKRKLLDENEQDSNTEEDEKCVIFLKKIPKISRQRSNILDTPGMAKGTSKSSGGTWASK